MIRLPATRIVLTPEEVLEFTTRLQSDRESGRRPRLSAGAPSRRHYAPKPRQLDSVEECLSQLNLNGNHPFPRLNRPRQSSPSLADTLSYTSESNLDLYEGLPSFGNDATLEPRSPTAEAPYASPVSQTPSDSSHITDMSGISELGSVQRQASEDDNLSVESEELTMHLQTRARHPSISTESEQSDNKPSGKQPAFTAKDLPSASASPKVIEPTISSSNPVLASNREELDFSSSIPKLEANVALDDRDDVVRRDGLGRLRRRLPTPPNPRSIHFTPLSSRDVKSHVYGERAEMPRSRLHISKRTLSLSPDKPNESSKAGGESAHIDTRYQKELHHHIHSRSSSHSEENPSRSIDCESGDDEDISSSHHRQSAEISQEAGPAEHVDPTKSGKAQDYHRFDMDGATSSKVPIQHAVHVTSDSRKSSQNHELPDAKKLDPTVPERAPPSIPLPEIPSPSTSKIETPRRTVRVYNDQKSAVGQPQTPMDLRRRGRDVSTGTRRQARPSASTRSEATERIGGNRASHDEDGLANDDTEQERLADAIQSYLELRSMR